MDPFHYWRANLKLVGLLLSIWFVTSFLARMVLVDWLEQFRFAGFGLGFFMAQQGWIYIFVILIFIYAYLMNRLDRRYHVDRLESEKTDMKPDEG